MSAYEAHARATMGWTGGELKHENPGLYQLAKARVLALGYGCGWKKFIGMALTMAGLDITRDDPEFIEQTGLDGTVTKVPGYGKRSREMVKEFRKASPKIVDFWNRLDGAFKSSIGGDFTLTLPNGRKMVYRNVRCSVTMEHSEELKRPVRKEVWTAKTDKPRYFYGGKLCENAVQAASRDVFGEHIVSLDKKGVLCLFTVHDEGIFEVDKGVSKREIEIEMSRCPDWLPGCPISAVAEEVEHYKK
jgi:DNA polymerase